MINSFVPKIIATVATSLLGKVLKDKYSPGEDTGFMKKFATSMAGRYTGETNQIPPVEFKHLGGSGGGSLTEAKISALLANLNKANFKENFYGNSALNYLSDILRADQLRKTNNVDIGYRTASTKTSISPESPTIGLGSEKLV